MTSCHSRACSAPSVGSGVLGGTTGVSCVEAVPAGGSSASIVEAEWWVSVNQEKGMDLRHAGNNEARRRGTDQPDDCREKIIHYFRTRKYDAAFAELLVETAQRIDVKFALHTKPLGILYHVSEMGNGRRSPVKSIRALEETFEPCKSFAWCI